MSLDVARERFRAGPVNPTAGDYLTALMDAAANRLISDGAFFIGLTEVAYWLTYGQLLRKAGNGGSSGTH